MGTTQMSINMKTDIDIYAIKANDKQVNIATNNDNNKLTKGK